jgi:hypothetical protein
MQKLLAFIDQLNTRNIFHRLNSVREAVMVEVAIPGERWEVEFFADGSVDVEIFRSDGKMLSGVEGRKR